MLEIKEISKYLNYNTKKEIALSYQKFRTKSQLEMDIALLYTISKTKSFLPTDKLSKNWDKNIYYLDDI